MRMHIDMADDLVARVDASAGQRGRSRFIREAVLSALERHDRVELMRSSRGSVADRGHDWDEDPAGWVQGQRRFERQRVG